MQLLLFNGIILPFETFCAIVMSEAEMRILLDSSDPEVLKEAGARLKALRIASWMTQQDLSDYTGIALRTIRNLENGKDVSFLTVIKVMRALNILQNLDTTFPEETIRPSQIRQLGKPRQRVRKESEPERTWKWGDEK